VESKAPAGLSDAWPMCGLPWAEERLFRKQKNALLWAGFGGLLLLMGGLGASAVSFLYQIELRHERIRRDFVSRNRTLEKLRSDLYLSGTYVRDFLLDSGPLAAAQHKAAYAETQERIESAASQYRLLLRPEEIEPFGAFTRELHSYFEVLAAVLNWSPQQRRKEGPAFIENELLPRRIAMVSLADHIGQLNEKLMEDSTARTIDLFSQFRIKLLALVASALGIGLLLAGTTLWRILQLEKESEMRFNEVARARSELQNLSSRVLAAQEEERRKISRELHDEVGQSLWAMSLGIGNLHAALKSGNQEEALRQIDLIRKIADTNARAVRNLSLLLRPSMLDDLGLVPALKWLAREISRTTDVQVDINAEELPEDLPDEHKTCIYRIVQEALRNCCRHARARHAWINLRAAGQRLLLYVQDDGAGFDPAHEKGLGLLGIEERVGHIGGTVQVSSTPGRGTTIGLQLPMTEKIGGALTDAAAAMPSSKPRQA
jgi:signal transduction histidine kinase